MFWKISKAASAPRVVTPAATGVTRGAGMRSYANQRVFQPAHLRAPKEMLRAPQRIIRGVSLIPTHAGNPYPIPPAKMLTAGQQSMYQHRGAAFGVSTTTGLGALDMKSPWVLGALGVVALVAGIYFVQQGWST